MVSPLEKQEQQSTSREIVTDLKIRICHADNSKICGSWLCSALVGMKCYTSLSIHKNLESQCDFLCVCVGWLISCFVCLYWGGCLF